MFNFERKQLLDLEILLEDMLKPKEAGSLLLFA
jgi:hypothetical protein